MRSENKTVVVIGEAKCGMTTLLKHLSDGRWIGTPDTICQAQYRANGRFFTDFFYNYQIPNFQIKNVWLILHFIHNNSVVLFEV